MPCPAHALSSSVSSTDWDISPPGPRGRCPSPAVWLPGRTEKDPGCSRDRGGWGPASDLRCPKLRTGAVKRHFPWSQYRLSGCAALDPSTRGQPRLRNVCIILLKTLTPGSCPWLVGTGRRVHWEDPQVPAGLAVGWWIPGPMSPRALLPWSRASRQDWQGVSDSGPGSCWEGQRSAQEGKEGGFRAEPSAVAARA